MLQVLEKRSLSKDTLILSIKIHFMFQKQTCRVEYHSVFISLEPHNLKLIGTSTVYIYIYYVTIKTRWSSLNEME